MKRELDEGDIQNLRAWADAQEVQAASCHSHCANFRKYLYYKLDNRSKVRWCVYTTPLHSAEGRTRVGSSTDFDEALRIFNEA